MKTLVVLSSLFLSSLANSGPTDGGALNLPNPLILLQLVPKMMESIREGVLSSQNRELPFTVVLREIQASMHSTPITDFSPAGIQQWANQIIQQIIAQINILSSPSTPPSPSPGQDSMDRDMTSVSSMEVSKVVYSLPDLAFDRDPSRKQAYVKMDGDGDEDELGFAIATSDQPNDDPADSELYLNDEQSDKKSQ